MGKTITIIPEKSRATNVGRIGVHFSPEHYDGFMKGHTYLEEYKQCEYQK